MNRRTPTTDADALLAKIRAREERTRRAASYTPPAPPRRRINPHDPRDVREVVVKAEDALWQAQRTRRRVQAAERARQGRW